ncbi:hypothetical protein ABH991_004999 [Bradyrhizobium ottawaense]|uniref:Uncharacterized protein n=2 Tax=Bradyrhizobium ottawaense TaxID=931866 RepID=A0ABV4G3N3_9BRAD|nr:hypothetical protein SG09_58290 [Bradyrhizobium ottawaense]BBO12381.1 hypothetical protein TM102_38510 [Bradyrhizobium sp. TM102]GMO28948.1 hypothetical protein BwSF21_29280 [Bradyrhizobium ottawaense]GMO37987.1 hypothetical protein BwSH14_46360 [Bradyrhizobium ottawaense]GMO44173.1 hypothetical protein BwSF12_48600 [Bradyrhizobium ottawaense]
MVAKIGRPAILPATRNANPPFMALHRDIFWVGRQWAVTGAGIQAVDQRLRGVLDIEIARLWDDDLVQSRRAKPGVNAADFDNALTVARERFPREPEPDAFVAQLEALGVIEAAVVSPAVPAMSLRAEGRLARFLPQWRIRR